MEETGNLKDRYDAVESRNQPAKLDALTGIRALAAIWVVLYHYPTHTSFSLLDYGYLAPVLHHGYFGVDLFFVLSGFIISYVYQQHFIHFQAKHVCQFLLVRLARLYPVHVAMLLAGLANYWLLQAVSHGQLPKPQNMYLPHQFFMALCNIHAWGEGLSGGYWNRASWSVSAEWFAYLLFPLTTVLFWAKPKSHRWFLTAALPALIIIILAGGLPKLDELLYTQNLFRVIFGFSWGVFIFNLYKRSPGSGVPWDRWALLCLGLLLWLLYGFPSQTLIVLTLTAFLFCLSRSNGYLSRTFSAAIPVHLGEISYSIYMVHGFFLSWAGIVMRKVLVPMGMGIEWHVLLFLGTMTIILGCSELMYRFVELPVRNYLRSRIDRMFQEKTSKPVQPLTFASVLADP